MSLLLPNFVAKPHDERGIGIRNEAINNLNHKTMKAKVIFYQISDNGMEITHRFLNDATINFRTGNASELHRKLGYVISSKMYMLVNFFGEGVYVSVNVISEKNEIIASMSILTK